MSFIVGIIQNVSCENEYNGVELMSGYLRVEIKVVLIVVMRLLTCKIFGYIIST